MAPLRGEMGSASYSEGGSSRMRLDALHLKQATTPPPQTPKYPPQPRKNEYHVTLLFIGGASDEELAARNPKLLDFINVEGGVSRRSPYIISFSLNSLKGGYVGDVFGGYSGAH